MKRPAGTSLNLELDNSKTTAAGPKSWNVAIAYFQIENDPRWRSFGILQNSALSTCSRVMLGRYLLNL